MRYESGTCKHCSALTAHIPGGTVHADTWQVHSNEGGYHAARASFDGATAPARTCAHSSPDGNRDDPTYYYCGYPAGHAGEHGAWRL